MPQIATVSVASLIYPTVANGLPQAPPPPAKTYSVTYEQAVTYPRLVISGAGSIVLADFSLLPAAGCQVLTVTLDGIDDTGAGLTAPVSFVMTGTTHGTIVLPIGGGSFSIVAPGAAGGVTGLTITSTAPAVVRVSALG